ncbi:hypothetical protein [Secundilactobacillus collinoides]|uniref:hypothetical protein n=1 Tax=Secundilactobacillus collinoides TaxID=33960 RepID=UPI00138F2757|nr:hypothetical protein [Secundilactobacillus collinoides]
MKVAGSISTEIKKLFYLATNISLKQNYLFPSVIRGTGANETFILSETYKLISPFRDLQPEKPFSLA